MLDRLLKFISSKITGTNQREILWTNPNPKAVFGKKTISLDLSGYDAVEIEFLAQYNFDYTFFAKCKIGKSMIAAQPIGTTKADIILGNVAAQTRSVDVTDNSITFGNGVFMFASDYNGTDKGCIPVKIYGIKAVGGGVFKNLVLPFKERGFVVC